MENKFHFGLKCVVIGQTIDLMKRFVESVPGVEVDPAETFRFLKVYTFPLYVSDSLILRIDLWALPDDVRQRGDAQLLCCDASIVFYVAETENDLLSILSVYHRDIRAVNAQCKYIACGNLSEDSLAALGKASGFTIQHIENMEPSQIAFVFKGAIASVISEIPNPPDPVFMLHKNIKLGSLLLDDPSYRRALRPSFPQ
ncbi:hypothetical protein TVAG_370540 [Trichomonas vaginalis G3]|uniref:Uncharacterized protein n=1 Tax=Trichomonas vaginalis (strain ATCC PRA-98 / G3) TaxID=412133 RepID=A2FJQ1_TRIV3|nr:GTPase protein [Trichomonas vaginalis G3]EAX94883.1 hypothetical protein TVAG_370540 [Trichomonas vaginalis G3]KAI5541493.1 GTPase protein [Trichomonas vaginalis G3]|eukprot:XP_001307813.1 hypothetical protein [Trichomonas vaginalis G3]